MLFRFYFKAWKLLSGELMQDETQFLKLGGRQMKKRIFPLVFAIAMGIIFAGCGGGGGDSSSSTGTVSMNITDAKPYLPLEEVESITITFNEVSFHKSGGRWFTVDTVTKPYTVDLYQFSDGAKTQFVPPVQLESGKYTQVRIGVASATMKYKDEEGVTKTVVLEIPSENLKTDKNFEFNVEGGGAVDLTVDFDLSQSIVVTGTGTYQLKPVLHLVKTEEAWTIKGNITSSEFGDPPAQKEAVVIVYWDSNRSGAFDSGVDEEYTRLSVQKGSSALTTFSIFWLVPQENYYVEVYMKDPGVPAVLKYSKFIKKGDWTSKIYWLEGETVALF